MPLGLTLFLVILGLAGANRFLERTAGFSIGEAHLLGLFAEPYSEEDSYGKTFLDSLPTFSRTRDASDARPFLEETDARA